jgi:protein involved in sex pheromone biosynthesis
MNLEVYNAIEPEKFENYVCESDKKRHNVLLVGFAILLVMGAVYYYEKESKKMLQNTYKRF